MAGNTMRTRWAAIGAAVAVTLGAGGVGLSQAALSSGPKPVFVAITPCRLVDTRPGVPNVGPRSTPLGANDTLTLQITGSTGKCSNVPADAVAAALNVTAIRPTAQSFLTVYPADAALPTASNLNWAAGDPPTPNKVDVKLGSTGANAGRVKLTNSVGEVHIAADLVGYYIDHTHADITADLGLVAYDETDGWMEMPGNSGGPLAVVSLTAPQASGGGYVLIQSSLSAFTTTPNTCPCEVASVIRVGDAFVGEAMYDDVGGVASEVGDATTAISRTAMVPIAAGQTLTIEAGAFNDDSSALGMTASISALFVPTKSPSSAVATPSPMSERFDPTTWEPVRR